MRRETLLLFRYIDQTDVWLIGVGDCSYMYIISRCRRGLANTFTASESGVF